MKSLNPVQDLNCIIFILTKDLKYIDIFHFFYKICLKTVELSAFFRQTIELRENQIN